MLSSFLGAGCVTKYVPVVVAPEPCVVQAWPPGPDYSKCDESDPVCHMVTAGLWIREASRYHEDVKACPQIVETPDV